MRKTWLFAAVALLILLAAVVLARPDRPPLVTAESGAAESIAAELDVDAAANLPAVFRAANTPAPEPTATQAPPTPTQDPSTIPTPPPTGIPAPSPTPGFGPNLLENGSFENGWTDLPPVAGNLTNQEPNGWELSWLAVGETVWDLRTIHPNDPQVGVVSGIAEMLHKLAIQLPDPEKPGGPMALILEGTHVYKMFHHGAAFGSQLSQWVTLPPGTYRLTVPVQLHWHEQLDPTDPTWDTFTAESGAWVVYGGTQTGGWATAREMGDRRWYYHVVEFTLAQQTEVEVRIRVKSIYRSAKDFFVDAVWLEEIG